MTGKRRPRRDVGDSPSSDQESDQTTVQGDFVAGGKIVAGRDVNSNFRPGEPATERADVPSIDLTGDLIRPERADSQVYREYAWGNFRLVGTWANRRTSYISSEGSPSHRLRDAALFVLFIAAGIVLCFDQPVTGALVIVTTVVMLALSFVAGDANS